MDISLRKPQHLHTGAQDLGAGAGGGGGAGGSPPQFHREAGSVPKVSNDKRKYPSRLGHSGMELGRASRGETLHLASPGNSLFLLVPQQHSLSPGGDEATVKRLLALPPEGRTK